MIWKQIPGLPYEASSEGKIRRIGKSICRKTRIHPRGYERLSLFSHGIPVGHWVHVFVCMAFHGPRPEGHEVSHKNHCRADNRPGNLEWTTRGGNRLASKKDGRLPTRERHHKFLSHVKDDEVLACKKRGLTNKEIAGKFKCSTGTISHILNGKRLVELTSTAGT